MMTLKHLSAFVHQHFLEKGLCRKMLCAFNIIKKYVTIDSEFFLVESLVSNEYCIMQPEKC